ncbi:hypothetical protein RHSIM_Rhsim06G0239400 [Rhododendron simsii]|uniref:Uncharacterized protein n=1 Tax=Rhododendron simsii TaxID=118357 RepID=A0A834GU18_RHOSS|nr:hypothetical protein RHSIM_Rhsim06G0239400 [Rhododendron simsii]
MIASTLMKTWQHITTLALMSYYSLVIIARILNHDDDVEVLYSFQRSFFIRRDEFLSDSMVDESISLAHLMVNDPKNVDRKGYRRDREFADEMAWARRDREFADVRARARRALPIAGHKTDDHDAIARATRESMQAVKFVPATKSSIESLEKVTILDNNSCLQVEQCRVCLEALSTAAEVHMLPGWMILDDLPQPLEAL